MPKKTILALAAAGVLTAGGWGAYEMLQPSDAERMPEIAAEDLAAIDALITETYASISGPVGQKRDRERMAAVFAEGATLTSMQPTSREFKEFTPSSMTPAEYADRSLDFLENMGFTEAEIGRTLEVYGTVAHAFSAYEGHFTNAQGEPQMVKGINSMQMIKVNGEWKMYTILWDQQWPEGRNPVPQRYITWQDGDGLVPKKQAGDDEALHAVDPDARRVLAGKCPHCEKFYPLLSNGTKPDECPICDEKL